MISITPADALWHPSQQKLGIYGVRTELKGTGSLPTSVIQKQVQGRGVQPMPVQSKAAFHTRQHLLVLSQRHGNSCRCWLQGSRMTRRSCGAGSPVLGGALTTDAPEWRGHRELKRDEASVCSVSPSDAAVRKCRATYA